MNYHFKFLLRTRGLAQAIQNESRVPSLARKLVKLVNGVILVHFLVKLAWFSFSVFYCGSKRGWVQILGGPNLRSIEVLNFLAINFFIFFAMSKSAIAEASGGNNISSTLSSRMQRLAD